MSWEIEWDGRSISYTFEGEEFEIDEVSFDKRDIRQEPSGGYQEPDDDIMEDTYSAETEHGTFKWYISATRSGFNSYADLGDVELISQPVKCDSESPNFIISND